MTTKIYDIKNCGEWCTLSPLGGLDNILEVHQPVCWNSGGTFISVKLRYQSMCAMKMTLLRVTCIFARDLFGSNVYNEIPDTIQSTPIHLTWPKSVNLYLIPTEYIYSSVVNKSDHFCCHWLLQCTSRRRPPGRHISPCQRYVLNCRHTVETLYSTIYHGKYFIEFNIDKSTQYVALWTHKRHPIPRPFGRAMECLLWVLQQKLIVAPFGNITTAQSASG